MANTFLQAVKTTPGSIAAGAAVLFNSVLSVEGDIAYDSTTGAFTLQEDGKYIVSWSVSSHSLLSPGGVAFSMVLTPITLDGNSPAKQGELTGFGVFDVSGAPAVLSLVNTSPATVYFAPDVPVQANILIQKFLDPASITSPYLDLPLIGVQTLLPNEFLTFADPVLQNGIQYDSTLRLVAILEPGIYQFSVNLFSDIALLRMNSISYPGDRDFQFPTGYGFKTLSFLERFDAANYIGFSNPEAVPCSVGVPGSNPNGGLVIVRISGL